MLGRDTFGADLLHGTLADCLNRLRNSMNIIESAITNQVAVRVDTKLGRAWAGGLLIGGMSFNRSQQRACEYQIDRVHGWRIHVLG